MQLINLYLLPLNFNYKKIIFNDIQKKNYILIIKLLLLS
jgi:hypothetical protein